METLDPELGPRSIFLDTVLDPSLPNSDDLFIFFVHKLGSQRISSLELSSVDQNLRIQGSADGNS